MRTPRLLLAAPLLLLPVVAHPAPSPIGLAAFGPGTTVFAFPDSGTTAPSGVTVSSAEPLMFGDPQMWDPSNPAFNSLAFDTLTLSLAAPVQGLGFYFGSNQTSTVTVSVGRQGGPFTDFTLTVTGDLLPADGVNNWAFHGFADLQDGIDTLVFGPNLATSGFQVGIGELQTFGSLAGGSLAGVAVPEPMTAALFGAGLVGLGLARRRRR